MYFNKRCNQIEVNTNGLRKILISPDQIRIKFR